MVPLIQTFQLPVQPRRQVGHHPWLLLLFDLDHLRVVSRMPSTDLDDYVPPAPPMQAPRPPPYENRQWGGDYPQQGKSFSSSFGGSLSIPEWNVCFSCGLLKAAIKLHLGYYRKIWLIIIKQINPICKSLTVGSLRFFFVVNGVDLHFNCPSPADCWSLVFTSPEHLDGDFLHS